MGISGLIDVDCSHQWVPNKTVILIPEKNAVHNTVWMMMLAVRRCDLSFWVWGSGHRDPTQTVRERSRSNPIQIDGYQVTRACVDNQAKYSPESPPPPSTLYSCTCLIPMRFDVGPPSSTLARHQTGIGWTFSVHRDQMGCYQVTVWRGGMSGSAESCAPICPLSHAGIYKSPTCW